MLTKYGTVISLVPLYAIAVKNLNIQNSKTVNNCYIAQMLFHRRTRASYVYNVCLAWYNVVLTHGSTQA